MVQTITTHYSPFGEYTKCASQVVICVIAGISICLTLHSDTLCLSTFCFRTNTKSFLNQTVLSKYKQDANKVFEHNQTTTTTPATNTSHVIVDLQQLPNQTTAITNTSHVIVDLQQLPNQTTTITNTSHVVLYQNQTKVTEPATNTSHAMSKQHNETAMSNKKKKHKKAKKLPRKHIANTNVRTLVIVTGQPRGSAYAWKSLDTHVLKPLHAHLATYFTDDCVESTYLAKMATYQWSAPAQKDWGFFLDQAQNGCLFVENKSEWRSLFEFKDQFLGGIAGSGHPGSGGIMLSFRWLVQQKINQLNLIARYDYMVLSRADQMHICDHPPILKTERVTVPFGLEYGGWPDRHSFGRISVMNKAINITTELVCDTDRWLPILRSMNSKLFNPEQVLKIIWDNNKLMVNQVNRTMFTVRSSTDPTRWSWGQEDPLTQPYNITVKYPEELELVKLQCADEAAIAKELRDIAGKV